MLFLPDNWIYSINGLIAVCKEGKKAIQSSIKELEDNNYLVRKKIQDDKGRINYRYDIFETPQHHFGCTDIGCTKKELLINTNNKDKYYTNIIAVFNLWKKKYIKASKKEKKIKKKLKPQTPKI